MRVGGGRLGRGMERAEDREEEKVGMMKYRMWQNKQEGTDV